MYILCIRAIVTDTDVVSEMNHQLWAETKHIMRDGIRDSTKNTYRSGQKDYLNFCHKYSIVPQPATENVIMMYATHLYKRGVKFSTIKVYLSAVRHMHIINGYTNPMCNNDRLHLCMRSLQYKCENPTEKLPITHAILERISKYLGNSHDHQLLWSAMTLGFFGLLRAAEFTAPSQSRFDPNVHLLVKDVSFRTSDNGQCFISVMVKDSKTDKIGKGYLIHIGCTSKPVCAVCSMKSYLNCKPSPIDMLLPLYRFQNGAFLTKSLLVSTTRTYIALIGINPDNYTGHSYRVGGATTAAEAGLNEWEIKLMGRWSSEAYQRYIKTSIGTIIGFSSRMIQNQ